MSMKKTDRDGPRATVQPLALNVVAGGAGEGEPGEHDGGADASQ